MLYTCCPSSSGQRLSQADARVHMLPHRHYSTFNDSSCAMAFNSWFREKKKSSAQWEACNSCFRQHTSRYCKIITTMGMKYG